MSRNYDKLFQSGFKAMTERLEANDHKPAFEEISIQEGVMLLDDENFELRLANYVLRSRVKDRLTALEELRHEAADNMACANFVVYACDREIERIKNEHKDS